MEPVAEQTVRWKLMAKESKDNTVFIRVQMFFHSYNIYSSGREGWIKKRLENETKRGEEDPAHVPQCNSINTELFKLHKLHRVCAASFLFEVCGLQTQVTV